MSSKRTTTAVRAPSTQRPRASPKVLPSGRYPLLGKRWPESGRGGRIRSDKQTSRRHERQDPSNNTRHRLSEYSRLAMRPAVGPSEVCSLQNRAKAKPTPRLILVRRVVDRIEGLCAKLHSECRQVLPPTTLATCPPAGCVKAWSWTQPRRSNPAAHPVQLCARGRKGVPRGAFECQC